MFPTSCTTRAVGPVPPVAYCPELIQRAFEAFRYHQSHDKFGRPHKAHGRNKPHYREICTRQQQGNCHNSYWTAGPRRSVWAQLIDVQGFAEGPFSHVLFGTNFTGLGTHVFYNALHNWLTSFEGVMHCVIANPYPHWSAHFHLHVATHGMARDIKAWFDNNHRTTLHLRHSPTSRVAVKYSNFTSDNTPDEVKIPITSL